LQTGPWFTILPLDVHIHPLGGGGGFTGGKVGIGLANKWH
jgi:hypothetical protein